MPIIDGHNLVKTFGKVRALDGAELVVERGQVHGFLGPNGAGKSTTIRAILGQLTLDSGRLTVFDLDPRRDAVEIHANLAYVPGDVVLWPNLTGGECLDLLAGFHRRDGRSSENRERRDQLVKAFDLDLTKKARTYSKGNRQKVALVSALSMDVDLYIFDEPTSGLDPIMEQTFQRAIHDRVAEGATVLLSSHILDEVEALCSHVTILREGKTVSSGLLEDLRQSTTTTILATFEDRQVAQAVVSDVTSRGATAEQVDDESGAHVTIKVGRSSLNDVTARVANQHPLSLVVRPPSLDELFLEHYRVDA